ncbi:MAG TPA: hypothetical protein VLF90_03885 [Patescibacteria group bacterium]|nr:hypothetical protein [Patescibacteria group bacterium]
MTGEQIPEEPNAFAEHMHRHTGIPSASSVSKSSESSGQVFLDDNGQPFPADDQVSLRRALRHIMDELHNKSDET